MVGGRWQVTGQTERGGGCQRAGDDQHGEQARAPAGAERGPTGNGAEQETGGERQGAEAVVTAGGAGRGEVVDDRREGRGQQALAEGEDDHGGDEGGLGGAAAVVRR